MPSGSYSYPSQWENPFAQGGLLYGFNPTGNYPGGWSEPNAQGSIYVDNTGRYVWFGVNNQGQRILTYLPDPTPQQQQPQLPQLPQLPTPTPTPPAPQLPTPTPPAPPPPLIETPPAPDPIDMGQYLPPNTPVEHQSYITAGPVWSDEQTRGAVGQMRGFGQAISTPGIQAPWATRGMVGSANQALRQNVTNQVNNQAIDFQRDVAYRNAQQNLASQQARANSSLQDLQRNLRERQIRYSPISAVLNNFAGG